MKKLKEFLLSTNFLSLALSLIVLVLYLVNTPTCEGNINNVIAALGVLVMVLVGWQIFNFLEVKKIQAEQKEIRGEFKDALIRHEIEAKTVTVKAIYIQATGEWERQDWNSVILLSTLVYPLLDHLTSRGSTEDMEQIYQVFGHMLEEAYTAGNILEKQTRDLLKVLEVNLENSGHARNIYFSIREKTGLK